MIDKTIMTRVITSVFSSRELERTTERLDRLFPGLNLSDLPEYQAAIDAVRNYGKAAYTHFEEKYEEGSR